ncbi:hypothetical protein SDC9_93228 [bioreactor metagenome]|uniref:Uncharacterized protein n=1 Tax=bioreactor metagenome TaxID=1076179 RepID=A0A644ZZZ1_9ZZZZ
MDWIETDRILIATLRPCNHTNAVLPIFLRWITPLYMVDAYVIFVRLIQRKFIVIVEGKAKLGEGESYIKIG